MLSQVVLFVATVAVCSAREIARDCGPADAYIKFHKIEVAPHPINIQDKANAQVNISITHKIGNDVRMSVNIKKSNLNGGFKWEVPCTNIGFIGSADLGADGYFGTCDYNAPCEFPFIKSWTTNNNCPAAFAANQIPCECPFPPKSLATTEAIVVNLADFKDYMPKWLIEGGYEVKVELKDSSRGDKLVGCLEMDFDAEVKIVCAPSLQRLGIC